ncbi:uncharacterized protein LOC124254898 [Haliotis rubra]|uniref:uncharacterized protein LOC124254898 n=1 Tax=Haliotis rubra TaxID=36100 RepID=UPI001EE5D395|nr:uncharacterized protein LOC124254898 [Haliotis rubra]
MLYLIGLNFALRSGVEHRIFTVDQIEIGENDQGEFIRYHEMVSKCSQRGLKDYHVAPKSVTAYASDVSDKCIVHLYPKYLGLRPADAPTALYLRPLSKPRPDRWYSVSPVGEHTLSKTVSRLCAAAGFSGFYTNHSLRATCATRLFRSGVDEQLIAKTTGHRSNAIRNYKRVCTEQEATMSRIVQGKPRKRRSETASMSSSSCEKSRALQKTSTDGINICQRYGRKMKLCVCSVNKYILQYALLACMGGSGGQVNLQHSSDVAELQSNFNFQEDLILFLSGPPPQGKDDGADVIRNFSDLHFLPDKKQAGSVISPGEDGVLSCVEVSTDLFDEATDEGCLLTSPYGIPMLSRPVRDYYQCSYSLSLF